MVFPFMAAAALAAAGVGAFAQAREGKKNRAQSRRGAGGGGGKGGLVAPGKFHRKRVQTKEQRKLLKGMSKEARKNLNKLTPLHKIPTSERSSIFQKARGVISDILSPDSKAAAAFEAPIRKQFNEKTLPEIAERFGGPAPQRSSAMQNMMREAGTDLDTSLGELRHGLQMQAVPMAANLSQVPLQEQLALRQSNMGMSQQALGTSPFNTVWQPPTYRQPGTPEEKRGFFSSFAPAMGQAAGSALGQAGINRMFAPTPAQPPVVQRQIMNQPFPS